MQQVLEYRIEDLVGREFHGFFQRSPELVLESRRYREKLKVDHPDLISQYDEFHGSLDLQDAAIDRKYDFYMKVLEFDPKSGLFIAKGNDVLGVSGLVGEVKGREIEFTKTYVGPKSPDVLLGRFRTIQYLGEISKVGYELRLIGTYIPGKGITNYSGIWHLISLLDSKETKD